MIWIAIALGFSLPYLLLQLYYLSHWKKIPVTLTPIDFQISDGVSILIVARNEEKNIGECIRGILNQHFIPDAFEIIIVNDRSSDGTVEEVLKIKSDVVHLYSLEDYPAFIHSPAFKKSGITLGVEKAKFENIIVTDADCHHPPQWLQSVLFHFNNNNVVFQTSPVLLKSEGSLLGKMQQMEQLVLMFVTGAGIQSGLHVMANGANMAFKKSAFKTIEGYQGNFQYASGDDMFLAEKMSSTFPDKITFAKSTDAIVWTDGKENWDAFFKQRFRWAGKNKGLQHQTISRIWTFVGVYHVLLCLTFILSLFNFISWWPFIVLLGIKWLSDFAVISEAAKFFKQKSILVYFIPLQILYTYYILRMGLGMLFNRKGDW